MDSITIKLSPELLVQQYVEQINDQNALQLLAKTCVKLGILLGDQTKTLTLPDLKDRVVNCCKDNPEILNKATLTLFKPLNENLHDINDELLQIYLEAGAQLPHPRLKHYGQGPIHNKWIDLLNFTIMNKCTENTIELMVTGNTQHPVEIYHVHNAIMNKQTEEIINLLLDKLLLNKLNTRESIWEEPLKSLTEEDGSCDLRPVSDISLSRTASEAEKLGYSKDIINRLNELQENFII